MILCVYICVNVITCHVPLLSYCQFRACYKLPVLQKLYFCYTLGGAGLYKLRLAPLRHHICATTFCLLINKYLTPYTLSSTGYLGVEMRLPPVTSCQTTKTLVAAKLPT